MSECIRGALRKVLYKQTYTTTTTIERFVIMYAKKIFLYVNFTMFLPRKLHRNQK